MPGKSELERALEQFRRNLLNKERRSASTMVRVYGQMWKQIKAELELLNTEYEGAKGRGEEPGRDWIRQFNRARAFRDQVERQLSSFAQYAEGKIRQEQYEAISAAEANAEALTRKALGELPEGVQVDWNRIPMEAVEEMVGLTQSNSPLHKLLMSISAEGAKGAENALIQGLLMGKNPRAIAPLIRDALGIPLSRALTIARTETLRAYRTATQQNYLANSDVLGGWIWHSACDLRTCAACVVGDTVVSGPGIQKVFSRYYSGDIVIITTASRKNLTVTPNHPILTDRGWVKAGLLKKGDNVISGAVDDGASFGVGINNYQMPTVIKDIAETFGVIAAEMPCSPPDFHGDGKGSNVYVVRFNSLLGNDIDSSLLEKDSKSWRDLLSSLSGKVCLDCVLDIHIRSFQGHVYNLQTEEGWYSANGIITHNCWMMHGTVHPSSEPMEDHPNGRCSMMPRTKSWAEIGKMIGVDLSDLPDTRPAITPGIDQFKELSMEEQMNILGPAKWAAWKEGKFELSDLVGRKYDKVWGGMRYEKSLGEILGSKQARIFTESTRTEIISGVRIPYERRVHWRQRHPEITSDIEKKLLQKAITKPDYVQPSKSDPYSDVRYILDENNKWWAVVISHPPRSNPFVLTFRRAHGKGK